MVFTNRTFVLVGEKNFPHKIKIIISIYFFLFSNLYVVLYRAFARLQVKWWWLGTVAGFTIGHAGYERSISHDTFNCVSPAILPNRLLLNRNSAALRSV